MAAEAIGGGQLGIATLSAYTQMLETRHRDSARLPSCQSLTPRSSAGLASDRAAQCQKGLGLGKHPDFHHRDNPSDVL